MMREAIILAGGRGTRLRAVVTDVPKPMAPVAGRPFLEIVLSFLAASGFRRVVLSLGHMADKVVTHFGSSFLGIELVYAVESEPLGTGGALRFSLAKCRSDHVFVFNGDTYLDLDVSGLESLWVKNRNPVIVLYQLSCISRYGQVHVQEGRVVGFSEKGSTGSGLINAGCYVVPVDIFGGLILNDNFSLEEDFLPKIIAERRLDVFMANGRFIDIGVPQDYRRAQQIFRHPLKPQGGRNSLDGVQ